MEVGTKYKTNFKFNAYMSYNVVHFNFFLSYYSMKELFLVDLSHAENN